MKEKQLTKVPACSWIEFILQTTEIYDKLIDIYDDLDRDGWYVANTKFVLQNLSGEEKKTMLYRHSERLTIAFGLINTSKGTTIQIIKNLRVCGDYHQFTKFVSKLQNEKLWSEIANDFIIFQVEYARGDFW